MEVWLSSNAKVEMTASLAREATNSGSSTPLLSVGSPTIRWRLFLFAVVCMAVAVSVAGTVFLSQARRERASVEGRVQRAAHAGAQFVEHEVAFAVGILSALSGSPALQDGDFAAFYRQASAVKVPPGFWFVLCSPDYASRADQLVNTRRPFGAPPQSEPASDTAKNLVRRVVATRQVQVSDLV